jgi:hypothetical protein
MTAVLAVCLAFFANACLFCFSVFNASSELASLRCNTSTETGRPFLTPPSGETGDGEAVATRFFETFLLVTTFFTGDAFTTGPPLPLADRFFLTPVFLPETAAVFSVLLLLLRLTDAFFVFSIK